MFTTHHSHELGFMRFFSEDRTYWRMVERNELTPWFHLTLCCFADGQTSTHTVMPGDVSLFVDLLNQPEGPVQVVDVQVVTPERLNKKGRWLMEPLAKLELAKTPGHEVAHIYTTVDGHAYYDLPDDTLKLEQLRDWRVLYVRPTVVPAMATPH
ncbi:hypothetical protein ACFPU0_04835 [Pseudomonas sp. GCM10022186]|uniref:hypothetical protein n=1 Tax=Pseudomonas sp. GCM10022186 TaxID=3252650 RepID=UPI00360D69C1